MQTNKLELDDIYGIWPVSFWNTPFGWAIISVLIIISLITIFLLVKKFYIDKQKLPWIIASSKLKTLLDTVDRKQLSGDVIYLKLTDILKKYFVMLYKLDKEGVTDWELLNYIEKKENTENVLLLLRPIIEHGQMAKFASWQIAKNQIKQDIANSISLIDITKPKSNEI